MKTLLLTSSLAIVLCQLAPAANPALPKNLAELNNWYVEPPADSNAATFYIKGIAALKITDDDDNSVNLPLIGKAQLPPPEKPLPPAMKAAVAAFLELNRAAFPFFEQGVKLDPCRYPIDLNRGQFTLLPHLPKIKGVAQVFELRAVSHALSGQGKQAGDDVLVGLALGQSLESEPLLISQLVRVACTSITVNGLEQVLNRAVLPMETLDRLQKMLGYLEEKEASGVGFRRAFVGERLMGLAVFDTPIDKLLGDSSDPKSEAHQSLDTTLDQIATLQAKPRPEAQAIIGADRRLFEITFDQVMIVRTNPFPTRLDQDVIFRSGLAEATNKNFIICSMFMGGLAKAASREAESVAKLRLAQTATALERYRFSHADQYPESIKQLIPIYLPAVPTDPFDSQSLRYRKAGSGFVLYSIGRDLKDDLGERGKASDGDLVFSVVNPPSRPQ